MKLRASLRRGRSPAASRRGATIVETALILPPLFVLFFGIMEFGHAQMVSNVLKAAARVGARVGATDGVSTAQVEQRVRDMLGTAVNPDKVTIAVKNGSIFDTAGEEVPSSDEDFDNLPNIELSDAPSRQLFIVRVSVPYESVGLLPPGTWRWLGSSNVVLVGQAVMRHE